MAIYHFSGTMISRSQGRSVVACAAYRAAARLQDETYGRLHDYTKKQDVVYAEILLPEGAPSWMSNREQLWNAVEAGEKRKDAQLSREFNFALPKELTIEQNIALTKTFVQKAFVDQGMVADVCVHNDLSPNGERQPHAHVLLTLRSVAEEGFGQKVRSWNAKEKLLEWRQQWAEMANQYLVLHGHDMRIDHRTLEAQGIDLEPQHKIGAASAKEQQARFADHQRIAYENGERIYADPEISLHALTRQQSTFTHQDLARFINRHTMDAEQFQRVYEKVKASPDLVFLGYDAEHRERFTTPEMLALEQRMVDQAGELAKRDSHGVSERVKSQVLSGYGSLTPEQQVAFESLMSGRDLNVVVGYAGTGKSYVLGAARQAWEAEGYRVLGATLSGIAAENLQGSSGIESRTLASHFYYWDKGERLLSAQDVLVVDEAGLIGSRQMARLVESVHLQGAKIVLVGDSQQLQAIEAGAAFRAIAERSPYVELTEIRRQQSAWQREATRLLAHGEVARALQAYDRHDHVHAFQTQIDAMGQLIAHWNDTRISDPTQSQMILACTRQEVYRLNQMAREVRQLHHELGEEHCVQTERGERYFAEQDRIYFLQNDRSLGVKNGTLGTIEQIEGSTLLIRLDGTDQTSPRQVRVDLAQYNHLDHGYAATIYKAQGVTVDRSYLFASRAMDCHATYVGLTRHRKGCDIFYSEEEFWRRLNLWQHLGRDRAKDTSLDYAQAFGAQRGFTREAFDSEEDLRSTVDVRKNPVRDEFHQKVDLELFRREFEAKHPDLAQQVRESMNLPARGLSQRFLEAEQSINVLNAQFAQTGQRAVKEQLERRAFNLLKDREMRDYIAQYHPQLVKQLEQWSRQYERRIEYDIER